MKIKSNAQRAQLYASIANEMPVKPKTILYQAYRSYIMSCSPFALFQELLNDEAFADFEHIWIYGSEEVLDYDTFSRFRNHPRVKLIQRGGLEHLQALATSGYLVTNAALPTYWYKREGQVVINTWHGTPLKALGKDARDFKSQSISNAQRNFLLTDYLVMPNRYTADKLVDSYYIDEIFPGQILDVGSPRVDLVLKADRDRIRGILEQKLGKPLTGKRVVLYAPTFRSSKGKGVDTTAQMAGYMNEIVSKLPEDCEAFFKVHNVIGGFFANDVEMGGRLLFDELETNELLSAVDVLVTDYSSIFFDFICTGRPIVFFTYDKESYMHGHGMYLDTADMPGVECSTVEEVVDAIGKCASSGYENPNAGKAVEMFAYNDDGHASRRVVDIVFGEKSLEAQRVFAEGKESILVSLGNAPRLSSAYILYMLLHDLDPEKHEVTIAVRDVHLIAGECAKLFPSAHILFSDISYPSDVQNVTKDETFYAEQLDNFFPGMRFDVYYNLKYGEGFVDELITQAIPECEKRWLFSWRQSFDVQDVIARANGYSQASIYCNRMQDVPEELHDCSIDLKTAQDVRSDPRHQMTVLMLAGFDSTNYALAACAKELRARGHVVSIVAPKPNDWVNNRMFAEAGIDVLAPKSVGIDSLCFTDIAIGSPVKQAALNGVYNALTLSNVFLVSFSNLFSSVAMRINPDMVLTLGEEKAHEFARNSLRYNCVAIGNPQYDELLAHKREKDAPVESVLVVEQGGYPYGQKGKKQLADALMRMANDNPQIRFDIKPRYLPEDAKSTLHTVSEHLFDFLEDAPENLVCLQSHSSVEEIVIDYDAMVTMWSTAYLDAVMLDMPLLLIGGLDSIDVFDVRESRVREAYEHLAGTGCVYSHEDLAGSLADKFRKVDEAYARDEVYRRDEPCAPRVASLLEHVYETLIVPGKRIVQDFATTEQGYYDGFEGMRIVDAWSTEYVARKRCRGAVNGAMQEYVYRNRCMGSVLDLAPMESYYDTDASAVEEEKLEEFFADLRASMAAKFLEIRTDYFEGEEGLARIERDRILQDFYFDWLYDARLFEGLEHPVVKRLLSPEGLEYNLARAQLLRGRLSSAYDHLFAFLNAAHGHDVNQLLRCKRMSATLRRFRRGLLNVAFFERLLRSENANALAMLYPDADRNALIALKQAHDLRVQGELDECIELCNKVIRRYPARGLKRKTPWKTVKLYMHKTLRQAIEMERSRAKAELGKQG